MKLKVVKVVKNGKEGYLNGTSIFQSDNVVDSPLQAINYALPENAANLAQDLSDLHLPDDEIYARSGVRVESAQIVELEITIQEVSCVEARAPHKMRTPQPR